MSVWVGIAGSREYPFPEEVLAFVGSLGPGSVVVTGGCETGVDAWAEHEAERLGLSVYRIRAQRDLCGPSCVLGHRRRRGNGDTYCPAAGIRRNPRVVAMADRMAIFWDGQSHGTADVLIRAQRSGKPLEVFKP
jgi:hypothetical protein